MITHLRKQTDVQAYINLWNRVQWDVLCNRSFSTESYTLWRSAYTPKCLRTGLLRYICANILNLKVSRSFLCEHECLIETSLGVYNENLAFAWPLPSKNRAIRSWSSSSRPFPLGVAYFNFLLLFFSNRAGKKKKEKWSNVPLHFSFVYLFFFLLLPYSSHPPLPLKEVLTGRQKKFKGGRWGGEGKGWRKGKERM